MTTPNTPVEFQELWDTAFEAGTAAGAAAIPTPMVVQQRENPFDDRSAVVHQETVNEGVCGFAWIIVKPGNSRFANWLKKQGYAKPDSYQGGVRIWISDYNQSMTRKEAHAKAMADTFRAAGFERCWDYSRMD